MQQNCELKSRSRTRLKGSFLVSLSNQCNRTISLKAVNAAPRPVVRLFLKLYIQASARLARSLELVAEKQVIAQYRRGRGSGGGVRGRVVWVQVGGTWTQETTRPARGLGLGCSSKGRSVILSRVRTRHTRCIGPDEVFETALGSSF